MTKHIGIVACSAEGAALCYRTLCTEGAAVCGRHGHPEVTMHTYPLSHYMRCVEAGDWEGVANLMTASAEKLYEVGADFVICPDNTIHQAFDLVTQNSRLPWLHIAEEVAAEASRHNYRCLGVLGTRYLMESFVYPAKLSTVGILHKVPDESERKRINEIIFDELVNGQFAVESRAYFVQVIEHLKHLGCDAVILGCTEIPLLISQEHSPLPILDSTRLLARAALKRATGT